MYPIPNQSGEASWLVVIRGMRAGTWLSRACVAVFVWGGCCFSCFSCPSIKFQSYVSARLCSFLFLCLVYSTLFSHTMYLIPSLVSKLSRSRTDRSLQLPRQHHHPRVGRRHRNSTPGVKPSVAQDSNQRARERCEAHLRYKHHHRRGSGQLVASPKSNGNVSTGAANSSAASHLRQRDTQKARTLQR